MLGKGTLADSGVLKSLALVSAQALKISLGLGASRLLIVEDSTKDIHQKIILNVGIDDLYYALNN